MIFLLILMGYAVIKVFFANLKQGRDPSDPDCSKGAFIYSVCQGDILMDLLAGASR